MTMSVACQLWQKSSIMQHLAVNQGLAGTMFVRYKSRKEMDKLPKPADKSKIMLGKVTPDRPIAQHGVSDKQHPILMQWNKPVRVETCNPEISGDLGGLEDFGPVDLTQPPVEWAGSHRLATAPSEVRRILSLEYRRNSDRINYIKDNLVKSMQRHPRDFDSLEVAIAVKTITIRNLQRDLIERYPYKNQPVKRKLTDSIAGRKTLLGQLRDQDYKRYEWVLERLNIFYKPRPVYDHIEISRKYCIERLTDIWCDELKRHRLDAYRRKLEEEQSKFLREKAAKLSFIMEEEKELGLEPTVTQEEVSACLARAEELEQRPEEQEEDYLCFQVEKAKERNVFIGA